MNKTYIHHKGYLVLIDWGWAASLSPSRDLPPGWTVQKLIANLPQIYFLAKSSINILRVIQVTRKRSYLQSFRQLSEYERIQGIFVSLPCFPFEFDFCHSRYLIVCDKWIHINKILLINGSTRAPMQFVRCSVQPQII